MKDNPAHVDASTYFFTSILRLAMIDYPADNRKDKLADISDI